MKISGMKDVEGHIQKTEQKDNIGLGTNSSKLLRPQVFRKFRTLTGD